MKSFFSLFFVLTIFTQIQAKESFAFGQKIHWSKSSPFGKYSITKDNILALDGRSSGVNISSDLLNNPEKGITLMAVVKVEKFPYLNEKNKMYDSIFCRRHQFMMGFYENRFYVNFHNGQKWFTPVFAKVKFDDEQFHSFAMTAKRTRIQSQGDDFLTIKMYFDGKLVRKKIIPNAVIADNFDAINLGYSKSFGNDWYLGGKIIDARGFNEVLSDEVIEEYTAGFPEIRNQPRTALRLNSGEQQLLDSLPQKGSAKLLAAVSAVRNIALKTRKFNWQNIAQIIKDNKFNKKNLEINGIYQYVLDRAILTVVAGKGYADAVSLFDTVNNRELLQHDNPFFRLHIKNDVFSPTTADVISEYVSINDKKFALKYKFKNSSAVVNFDCSNNRISYFVKAIPAPNISFTGIEFPALELRNLSENAALFVPEMSGVEHPAAVKNNVNYESEYPRATASMQFGAFYDDKGGIFWSPADPLARAKELSFLTGTNRLKIIYHWNTVFNSVFEPGCPVRLEFFNGRWFEAAMIYRQMLSDIDALYWSKEPLPRNDSPEWLKNNTLWFLNGNAGFDVASQFKKIRDYLKMPFGVHLYNWNSKIFDRDYPHHKPLPSFWDLTAKYHSMGIRVTPYTNGRLWEILDRREDDYLYSKIGKANCIRLKDGNLAENTFNKVKFNIICPYTPVYNEMMRKNCFMLEQLGADGIYLDQIGAAAHIMCYDRKHGHAVPDDTAWFLNGHHKVFSNIRAEIKARTPEFILTTEDNAETCIRNFDALLTWRWINKGQIPAFSAVYSGRTQLIGLSYDLRRDKEASFAKAAWQLIGGGQLGWFDKNYFCAPDKHDFRVWIKQLMRLRMALLSFFNEGKMAAPVKFKKPVNEKDLFWASRGTGYVNTPDLYSTTWRKGNIHTVILTNNSLNNVNNSLNFTPGNKGKVFVFCSNGYEKSFLYNNDVKYDFNLPSHSFLLLVVVPDTENADKLLKMIQMQFKIIAAVPFENDPFDIKKKKIGIIEKETEIINVATAGFECQFFPGAMYPTAFAERNGTALSSVRFADSIENGKNIYYLDCDRWAEYRIVENSSEKFVIEISGTFCTADKEYAAERVSALYRYIFKYNSPDIEIEAKVIVPENTGFKVKLLDLQCDNKNSRIFRQLEMQEQKNNIFVRKGKIFIK